MEGWQFREVQIKRSGIVARFPWREERLPVVKDVLRLMKRTDRLAFWLRMYHVEEEKLLRRALYGWRRWLA